MEAGLKRLFQYLIPLLLLLSFVPVSAGLRVVSYNTTILGTAYNYTHRVAHQVFETRYCPLVAAVLLAASWLVLLIKRDDLSGHVRGGAKTRKLEHLVAWMKEERYEGLVTVAGEPFLRPAPARTARASARQ